MRPVEFAPELIIEAGQALQSIGRNITGFALRQKVGGGSPSRLKQVWDEYLGGLKDAKAEPVAELPVEVADEVATVTKALAERLSAFAVELNDKAVKAAERRVQEVARTAGEQRTQAERELSDAAQTVDDLEVKLDEATGQVETQQAKLDDLQTANQAQAVELAQLRERVNVTEQTAKAAEAQHTAELARMNAAIGADRARYQQEADQLRAELAEQKQASGTAASERDALRLEMVTTKASTESELRQALDTVALHRLGIDEANNMLAQIRDEMSASRNEAVKLKGQLELSENHITALLQTLKQREDLPAKKAPAKKALAPKI